MTRKNTFKSLLTIGLLITNQICYSQTNCAQATGVSVSQTAVCTGTPITLNANLPTGLTAINWYTTPTGGTPIATTNGPSVSYTPNTPGIYTYYAEAVGTSGSNATPNYTYTGAAQSVILQAGTYLIETWGANGYTQIPGHNGIGGYAKGTLSLASTQTVYIYVGQGGFYPTSGVSANTWTFNGGGTGYPNNNSAYGHGGGASDVRTIGGSWDDLTSLGSRIIVAGGGGAGRDYRFLGGHGGGNVGGTGTEYTPDQAGGPTGGSQTAGGENTPWTGLTTATLGKAMTWDGGTLSITYLAGGGGGYYGGGSGRVAGGGGSSYTGGVTGGSTIMYGQPGFIANPSGNDNGYVRITGQQSCTPAARVATNSVTVSDAPIVNLGADVNGCEPLNWSNVLDATTTGATSYLWNTNANTPTITVTQNGTYHVVVANSIGCSTKDTIIINNQIIPSVDLGPNQTICDTDTITIDGTTAGASSYLWSNGATTPTIKVWNSGTYKLSVRSTNGCTASDSLEVTVANAPIVNLGADVNGCEPLNWSNVLDATTTGATSYLWNTNANTPTITVTQNGTYHVVVANSIGCSTKDTIIINNQIIPSVDLGPNQSICETDTISIDGTTAGASSYLWSNGATTPTIKVWNSGTYKLSVRSTNGCTASDSLEVTVANAPIVNLGADVNGCEPLNWSNVLDATTTGATSYLWNTNANTPTITVTQNGTYHVVVANSIGCSTKDTIIINNQIIPSVDLGPNQSICETDTITIDGTTAGASNYLWSNGAITPTIKVWSSGTYKLSVRTTNGCTASDSLEVTVVNAPIVNLGADVNGCEPLNWSNVLDATTTGATSYLWNTNANTPTITITQNGTYHVVVANSIGCSTKDTIIINNQIIPSVDLGPNQTICDTDTIAIDGTTAGASSYLWSNGAITPIIKAWNSGTYKLSVRTTNGCTASDSLEVTISNAPIVNLGADINECEPLNWSNVLDATTTGATSYLWNTNANTPTITVTQNGTYYVVVANSIGCSSKDTIIINNQIIPSIDLGPNQTICDTDTITIDGTSAGVTSYLWNNGAITATIKAWISGTYKLSIQSTNGCTASDSLEITVHDYPVLDLGNAIDKCIDENEYYFLDARNPGATYLWDDNYNGQIRAIDQSGKYWVKVTNSFGCASYDTIQVNLKRNPAVNLPNDTTVCEETILSLFAGNDGIQYYWNTGATTSRINTALEGIHKVVVTASNGCVVEDSINIIRSGNIPTHEGIRVINLGKRTFKFNLVDEENITNYAWDFGDGSPLNYASNPEHTYAVNGNYIVRILLNSVCGSITDTSTVHVISDGTNIDDILKANIKIYPNPTQDKVYIDIAIPINIKLYSIDGKLIKTIEKSKELDLKDAISGMYLLHITDENNILLRVEKIIKE